MYNGKPKISYSGYKKTSNDKEESKLRIPSGRISMKDVDHPVMGVDNMGNSQMMLPGQEYLFPGSYVDETPILTNLADNSNFKKGGNMGNNWIQKADESMKRKGTKGAFTEYCGGKVTESCIEKGLNSSDPTTRKRAAFAKAMRHVSRKDMGGDDIPGGQIDGIVASKKNMFMNYVQSKAFEALANEESSDIEEFHNKIMKQYGGTTYNPEQDVQQGEIRPPFMFPMAQGQEADTLPNNQPVDIQSNYNQMIQWMQGQPLPDYVQQTVSGNSNPLIDPNQTQGMSMTSTMNPDELINIHAPKSKLRINHGEAVANWTIAGMNSIAGLLEQRDNKKYNKLMAQRKNADGVFTPVRNGSQSRGDYEVNSGAFRPDDMVPTQFQGYNTPYYQLGGSTTYVTDPNDPRLRAYNDSMTVFRHSINPEGDDMNKSNIAYGNLHRLNNEPPMPVMRTSSGQELYKKPVMPFVYKKPQPAPIVPVSKASPKVKTVPLTSTPSTTQPTIVPQSAPTMDSNRTAVGFGTYGIGTVSYRDNTTGQIINVDAKGNPLNYRMGGGHCEYQLGSEVEMDDKQIQAFLKMGGSIELLD